MAGAPEPYMAARRYRPCCANEPKRSGEGWSEVMVGYGTGGGLVAQHAPMKLHLFEYIVRRAWLSVGNRCFHQPD